MRERRLRRRSDEIANLRRRLSEFRLTNVGLYVDGIIPPERYEANICEQIAQLGAEELALLADDAEGEHADVDLQRAVTRS